MNEPLNLTLNVAGVRAFGISEQDWPTGRYLAIITGYEQKAVKDGGGAQNLVLTVQAEDGALAAIPENEGRALPKGRTKTLYVPIPGTTPDADKNKNYMSSMRAFLLGLGFTEQQLDAGSVSLDCSKLLGMKVGLWHTENTAKHNGNTDFLTAAQWQAIVEGKLTPRMYGKERTDRQGGQGNASVVMPAVQGGQPNFLGQAQGGAAGAFGGGPAAQPQPTGVVPAATAVNPAFGAGPVGIGAAPIGPGGPTGAPNGMGAGPTSVGPAGGALGAVFGR